MYTGNTHLDFEYNIVESVYPCVYREHVFRFNFNSSLCGLSLCIQGTLFDNINKARNDRFIPVYTGNTF